MGLDRGSDPETDGFRGDTYGAVRSDGGDPRNQSAIKKILFPDTRVQYYSWRATFPYKRYSLNKL